MVQRLMRGAIPIRFAIAEYLKNSYPEMRLQALRTWPGMKATELPSIEVFSPFELTEMATGQKPRLGVEVSRATGFTRTDISEYAEEEYRARYNVRVTYWLYSQSDETGDVVPAARGNAIRQRDDNMAVLRACLLERPSLATEFLYMDENTYTEEYLTPVPVPNNSQRWAVGGQIVFDVQSDEQQAHKALSDPDNPLTFEIETAAFGGHPSTLITNLDKLR